MQEKLKQLSKLTVVNQVKREVIPGLYDWEYIDFIYRN